VLPIKLQCLTYTMFTSAWQPQRPQLVLSTLRQFGFTVGEEPPVPSVKETGRVPKHQYPLQKRRDGSKSPQYPLYETAWVHKLPVPSVKETGWVQKPPVPSVRDCMGPKITGILCKRDWMGPKAPSTLCKRDGMGPKAPSTFCTRLHGSTNYRYPL
jgi:hypothetical protein